MKQTLQTLNAAKANLAVQKRRLQTLIVTVLAMVAPMAAHASTTGGAFQSAYQFIFDAATGYLGRGIAIIGGVIGLGLGAATGTALPAIIGVILAIFGALGPTIIDTIFASATI